MRTSHLVAPEYAIRLTIPAREAIMRADPRNRIDRPPSAAGVPVVTLTHPPADLIVVAIIGSSDLAARLSVEPEWPGECAAAWWDRGAWVPCPARGCGRALLWCEAGFVPGWRICLAGHAVQLSGDGRSATRERRHDAATLRSTLPL